MREIYISLLQLILFLILIYTKPRPKFHVPGTVIDYGIPARNNFISVPPYCGFIAYKRVSYPGKQSGKRYNALLVLYIPETAKRCQRYQDIQTNGETTKQLTSPVVRVSSAYVVGGYSWQSQPVGTKYYPYSISPIDYKIFYAPLDLSNKEKRWRVGRWKRCFNFTNTTKPCNNGIHCFLTVQEAIRNLY